MGKARVKCLWQMTLLGEVLLYVSVSRREKAWPQVWIRLTVPNSVGERDEQNQNGNCLNVSSKVRLGFRFCKSRNGCHPEPVIFAGEGSQRQTSGTNLASRSFVASAFAQSARRTGAPQDDTYTLNLGRRSDLGEDGL
jgi:hypothetical protein